MKAVEDLELDYTQCIAGVKMSDEISEAIEKLREWRAKGHPDGCLHRQCLQLREVLRGWLDRV